MLEETTPLASATSEDGDEGFQLSGRERRLIGNFREMKTTAQDMVLDLSEQYKRTLPAVPVKLTLVSSARHR